MQPAHANLCQNLSEDNINQQSGSLALCPLFKYIHSPYVRAGLTQHTARVWNSLVQPWMFDVF